MFKLNCSNVMKNLNNSRIVPGFNPLLKNMKDPTIKGIFKYRKLFAYMPLMLAIKKHLILLKLLSD